MFMRVGQSVGRDSLRNYCLFQLTDNLQAGLILMKVRSVSLRSSSFRAHAYAHSKQRS